MGLLYYVGVAALVTVASLLSLVVLAQKSRSGSLFSNSGAIGAAGKPAAITWATSMLFGLFLVVAVLLNVFAR